MDWSPPLRPSAVAIILAGAVTKGAFEAGVLQVLAERGIRVTRIVAASSGALNGAAYAAGVRCRRERAAAANLVSLWEERGGLCDVLSPSLRDIVRCRGFSDQRKLRAMLRDNITPCAVASPAPIELHLITAPLRGSEGSAYGEPSTTFTCVQSFTDTSFDDQAALDRMFDAATASAALPGLYAPVCLPDLGPCVDGGLVANTPIRYAYGDDGGASIGAILVIAATPAFLGHPRRDYRGGRLLAHVIDMVFSEWLYHDLRHSRLANARLRVLGEMARKKGWSTEEFDELLTALGWRSRKVMPIISIRPVTPLPGTLLSGFLHASIRRRYVAVGVERGREVLDQLGWG